MNLCPLVVFSSAATAKVETICFYNNLKCRKYLVDALFILNTLSIKTDHGSELTTCVLDVLSNPINTTNSKMWKWFWCLYYTERDGGFYWGCCPLPRPKPPLWKTNTPTQVWAAHSMPNHVVLPWLPRENLMKWACLKNKICRETKRKVRTNWNSVAAPAPASAFLSAPAVGQNVGKIFTQLIWQTPNTAAVTSPLEKVVSPKMWSYNKPTVVDCWRHLQNYTKNVATLTEKKKMTGHFISWTM